MRHLWFRLALASGLLLLWQAAAAQNPCGYAFTITGQKLYADHCAACHGPGGTGGGPLAAKQIQPPGGLTGIQKRNGGRYPADRITEIIRYGGGIPGHEWDQRMPAWGKVFSGECGPAYSRRAVVELNRYLISIQK